MANKKLIIGLSCFIIILITSIIIVMSLKSNSNDTEQETESSESEISQEESSEASEESSDIIVETTPEQTYSLAPSIYSSETSDYAYGIMLDVNGDDIEELFITNINNGTIVANVYTITDGIISNILSNEPIISYDEDIDISVGIATQNGVYYMLVMATNELELGYSSILNIYKISNNNFTGVQSASSQYEISQSSENGEIIATITDILTVIDGVNSTYADFSSLISSYTIKNSSCAYYQTNVTSEMNLYNVYERLAETFIEEEVEVTPEPTQIPTPEPTEEPIDTTDPAIYDEYLQNQSYSNVLSSASEYTFYDINSDGILELIIIENDNDWYQCLVCSFDENSVIVVDLFSNYGKPAYSTKYSSIFVTPSQEGESGFNYIFLNFNGQSLEENINLLFDENSILYINGEQISLNEDELSSYFDDVINFNWFTI